jgi:tetratricopeptide (TPR) repeat protein
LARTEANPIDRGFSVSAAEQMLGDALARSGNAAEARGAYERALAAWPKNVEYRPQQIADHAALLLRLGRQSEASKLRAELTAMGYRAAT